MSENRISIQFSEADAKDINQVIKMLITKFSPYLIALTADDKRAVPKVGDKGAAFMQKSAGYMDANPEFIPMFLDKAEADKDFEGFSAMHEFLRLLAPLVSNMEDTALLCGSEFYRACLNYYDTVKRAAENNVPGARAIYEDLKVYFDAQRAKPQAAKV
ncbi:MAG: hypothetical protein WA584_19540 [Pyrinomonadaceae bacterium]